MKIICQLRKENERGGEGKERKERGKTMRVSTYTAVSVAGSGIVLTFSTRDSFDFPTDLQWEVLSSFLMVVDQHARDGKEPAQDTMAMNN